MAGSQIIYLFKNKLNNMESQKKLYSGEDINTMRVAEKSRMNGKNRVDELINYAKKSGVKRIGIAHCVALQKEADQLKARLSNHFETFSVGCKVGGVTSAVMLDDENAKGLSCNPAGQAEFLAANNTELNISVGLCVGHDIVFNQKSTAPTTTLIVKDREHKHNPYKEFETK